MLKDQDIICFSSIDWDFIWQGHQEIMSSFAKNGNRVLFVENTGVRRPTLRDLPRLLNRLTNWRKGVGGIRQENKNLYIYSPLILPFPYSRIARLLNSFIMTQIIKKWEKVLHFSDSIAWVFLPSGTILSVIKNLSPKIVLYYCVDDLSQSSKLARKIVHTERELLQGADLVFATSDKLYQKCLQFNKNVFRFPFGFNPENFNLSRINSHEKPHEIAKLKTPLIGYIGGVHRWINQQLVKDLAQKHPDCSFIFVGPVQTEIKTLLSEKNLIFLGQKPKEALPLYVHHFSMCLIPYKITPYTTNVYPTKLNEYLVLGKPVISTPLPEVLSFNRSHGNVVEIAENAEEFSSRLNAILRNENEGEKKKERIEVALRNTWPERIEKMCLHIEKSLQERSVQEEKCWRENLVSLYKKTRRTMVKTTAVLVGCYLLVFHSPFLWWIAEPLRISNPPVRSDVIAVLAGGVGESGLAGQGYQERVQWAVNLYQQGYADHLLFCSGYVLSMQEAVLMRALAVELGVPKDKIILEKRPVNTYDYIVYLKEYLQRHNWNSVMIVSSPYHMRRVSLVAKKVLPQYRVRLSPLKQTEFFGNRGEVKIRHVRAILHEYLGLVYYAYKKYI